MKGTQIALPIALLAAAAGLRADFLDSPMVRLGDELDLYFTAKARVEYDDNLFLGTPANNLPDAGTSYDLIPGLELAYGKDLPLSGSFGISRRYRTFFDRALRNLDDEQDSYNFTALYEAGGPLRVEAAATYAETARNDDDLALLAGSSIAGTLVRQTNYLQSVKAVYQFTEKTNAGLGVRHSSNRYDPVARVVVNPLVDPPFNTIGLRESDSWAVPLDVRYKYSEKLSVGISLEYGETDLTEARPFSDFIDTIRRQTAGLTLNYMATDKLDCEMRLGYLRSTYLGLTPTSARGGYDSPSFLIRLSHSTTDKVNQGLVISQDASASPNGNLSDSFQVGYDLNYNNSEALRSYFRATYSTSSIKGSLGNAAFLGGSALSGQDIVSANLVLGASYAPDSHWVYSANYSYSRNIEPRGYDVNRVSVEAALRW